MLNTKINFYQRIKIEALRSKLREMHSLNTFRKTDSRWSLFLQKQEP